MFGGKLHIMVYGDIPEMDGMPITPPPEAVAHAELSDGLISLAGGDDVFADSPSDLSSSAYSFLLQPGTIAQAQTLIDALVEGGGKATMTFEKAPWGAHYGQVVDKFGVTWAFNVDEDVEAAEG